MRDRPLAVLDPAGAGPQRPLLLRGWSDDVVLLTNGPAQLTVPERERLAVARIPVDERRVENLIARDGQLEAIAFAGGGRLARAGLLLGVRLRQRSPLAGRLGVPAGDPTPLALDPIAVDPLQRTGVPGVFAAGDVTGGAPSVASAIAAGSLAAASVVHSLIEDDEGAGD
jgi:hypothetical protein